MISKDFVIAGKAIFTIQLNEEYAFSNDLRKHYTFKVSKKENPENERFPVTYFVNLLTGPDNTSDYSYLGFLNADNGSVRITAKSCLREDHLVVKILNRALSLIWAQNTQPIIDSGCDIHHEGRCGRCGRVLDRKSTRLNSSHT